MKFTYFWLTGKKEVLVGESASDALNKAGYSEGALRALDFYVKGDDDSYKWSEDNHSWIKKLKI